MPVLLDELREVADEDIRFADAHRIGKDFLWPHLLDALVLLREQLLRGEKSLRHLLGRRERFRARVEIVLFQRVEHLPRAIRAEHLAVAAGTTARPEVKATRFGGDLQVNIFPPQIFQLIAFQFEEVLAFLEMFLVVREVTLNVVCAALIRLCELLCCEHAFRAILNGD